MPKTVTHVARSKHEQRSSSTRQQRQGSRNRRGPLNAGSSSAEWRARDADRLDNGFVSSARTPCRCRLAGAEASPCLGSDLHATAPKGLFNGLIWPEAGCASIAYDATAASDFLPLTAKAVIPRETRKPSLAVEPLRGAPSIASGQTIAIEAAMVRARERRNGDLKWRP